MRKWAAVPPASALESLHVPAFAFVPPNAAAIQSDGKVSVAETEPASAAAQLAGANLCESLAWRCADRHLDAV